MTKIIFSKSFIANTVTSFNIFCGFISILFTVQNNFKMAAIFIIVAAIFDILDGIIARLLDTTSKFGVELDSLSDIVSFGAAPSILIYEVYAYHFGIWGIILSSFLLVFGAFRLARFNVMLNDFKDKGDFTGLPIPLSAITVAAFVISFYDKAKENELYLYLVIPLIILLSFLMVSKIRYSALPKLKNRKFKVKLFLFFTLFVALLIAIVTNGEILFFIFLAIVLYGVVRYLYYLIFTNKNVENGSKISESKIV